MSLRADNVTYTAKVPDLFSDFFTDFTKHPITKELARARNEQAIKQSIRNLIFTNYGERFYQPEIGSHVNRALFEPNDDLAIEDVQYHIEMTLKNNERRINVLRVDVAPDRDALTVNIIFSTVNSNVIQSMDVLIRRVR